MKPPVLIVDDSLTVRMDLQESFDAGGFATTACEVLATARNALASHAFSLVVLDVMLPDGDGIELLREIKSTPATSATHGHFALHGGGSARTCARPENWS